MKKLLFIAVFGLGGLAASAQVTDPTDRTTDPIQQQTTDPTQRITDPTEQTTDPVQQQTTDQTQEIMGPTKQTTDTRLQRTSDPAEQEIRDPAEQSMKDPTQQRTTDSVNEDMAEPTQKRRAASTQEGSTDRQGTSQQATTTEQGYNEIATEEIPRSLKKAVKKKYPKGEVDKVYTNDQGKYKVEVNTFETVYMDKEGNPMELKSLPKIGMVNYSGSGLQGRTLFLF